MAVLRRPHGYHFFFPLIQGFVERCPGRRGPAAGPSWPSSNLVPVGRSPQFQLAVSRPTRGHGIAADSVARRSPSRLGLPAGRCRQCRAGVNVRGPDPSRHARPMARHPVIPGTRSLTPQAFTLSHLSPQPPHTEPAPGHETDYTYRGARPRHQPDRGQPPWSTTRDLIGAAMMAPDCYWNLSGRSNFIVATSIARNEFVNSHGSRRETGMTWIWP